MKTQIRTAVIGVGNMGRHHARIYADISRLTAVTDIDKKKGREVAMSYKSKWYRDYKEMLSDAKIDAISVCVPTALHKEAALACLKKNIPTLVEKPIADSIRSAKQMMHRAKKNKVLLMVGHIERYNPAIIKLKKLIDQGRFGKIISLLVIRVGLNPPPAPNSDVAIDLAIHDVDIFNYLLDEFPKSKKVVRNKIFKNTVSDSSSILLEYKTTTGMIQTNWITPIKMRKLYVTGTDGFAEVDYIRQKLILYGKITNAVQYGDYIKLLSLSEAPQKEVYISKKEPLKQELLFFLHNIKNWRLNRAAEEAIGALKVLMKS